MKKSIIVISLVALFSATRVFALGIGAPEVHSFLGRPLNVTAPLILEDEQLAQLESGSASVANKELFRQFELQYQTVHGRLQVALRRQGGEAYVELSTRRPFTEPLLELPLEIRLGKSRLVRVMTLLVDPPSANSSKNTSYNSTAPVSVPQAKSEKATPSLPAPQKSASTAIAQPRVAQMPSPPQRHNGSYGPVALHQTLGDIAEEIGYEEATLYQNLVALWEANPKAFLRNNMNHLKAGSTLRVPSRDKTLAYSVVAAKQEVLSQYTESQHPTAVATADTVSPSPQAPAEPEPQQQVSVDSPTNEQESQRLKLTAPLASGKIPPEFREEFNSLYVALDETEQENVELRARISLLEKQVAAMSQMLLSDAADKIEQLNQAAEQMQSAEHSQQMPGEVHEPVEEETASPKAAVAQSAGNDSPSAEHEDTQDEELVVAREQMQTERPALGSIESPPPAVLPEEKSSTLAFVVIGGVVFLLLLSAGGWLLHRRRQWRHYQQLFRDF